MADNAHISLTLESGSRSRLHASLPIFIYRWRYLVKAYCATCNMRNIKYNILYNRIEIQRYTILDVYIRARNVFSLYLSGLFLQG